MKFIDITKRKDTIFAGLSLSIITIVNYILTIIIVVHFAKNKRNEEILNFSQGEKLKDL